MSTLEEIEAAAGGLSAEQQQELLLFVAAKLREQGALATAPLPPVRTFTREQVSGWIAEDEADLRTFNANPNPSGHSL